MNLFSLGSNGFQLIFYATYNSILGTHESLQYFHMFFFGGSLIANDIMLYLNNFIIIGSKTKNNNLFNITVYSLLRLPGPIILDYIFKANDNNNNILIILSCFCGIIFLFGCLLIVAFNAKQQQ